MWHLGCVLVPGWRTGLVLAVAMTLSMAHAPRASACQCLFEGAVYPAADADGVPRDTVLVTRTDGSGAAVLRDAAGQEVPLEVVVQGEHSMVGVEVLRPVAPLEPLSTYTLTLMGSWPDERSFTTGEGFAAGALPAPALGEVVPQVGAKPMAPEAEWSYSSCDVFQDERLHRIALPQEPVPDEVLFQVVELRVGGEAAPSQRRILLRGEWDQPHALGHQLCLSRAPQFAAGAEVCATVRSYDAAGNGSTASAEVCSQAAGCTLTVGAGSGPGFACAPVGPSEDPGAPAGCGAGGGAGLAGGWLLALLAWFGRRRG